MKFHLLSKLYISKRINSGLRKKQILLQYSETKKQKQQLFYKMFNFIVLHEYLVMIVMTRLSIHDI